MWSVQSAGKAHWIALAERERALQELGRLCRLPADRRADACGRSSCAYFDQQGKGCGLLRWHIPQTVGVEGLRWFVDRRGSAQPTEPEDLGELVLLQTFSL